MFCDSPWNTSDTATFISLVEVEVEEEFGLVAHKVGLGMNLVLAQVVEVPTQAVEHGELLN